jgi:hypothetical protein
METGSGCLKGGGTCPEQDALADEIERRGLDL